MRSRIRRNTVHLGVISARDAGHEGFLRESALECGEEDRGLEGTLANDQRKDAPKSLTSPERFNRTARFKQRPHELVRGRAAPPRA